MSNPAPNNDDHLLTTSMSEAFLRLQEKLPAMWTEIGSTDPGGQIERARTIVVLPSLSLELEVPSVKQQAYEERFLFMLFILSQPTVRMIYITSQAIKPEIVDYYLDFLPGSIVSNARKRLFLISPEDGSPSPLTKKLLQRPRLIGKINSLILDHDNAHIVPFNTTDLEREFAVRLGIPMYAADPSCFALGTKSGARRLFTEEGIEHPLGFENLFSEDEAVEAIIAMRRQKRTMAQVIVKLNEGVGGMGNAVVKMPINPGLGPMPGAEAVTKSFQNMRFELEEVTYNSYMALWQEHGGVVEEFVGGEEVYSPSVQLRNSPLGEVQILSTHDQMLGGPSGQSYLGAIFPARPEYKQLITREADIMGRRLVREGVIGRYAVDFLVVRDRYGDWYTYAIEINLRKGGTTTPYLTLQYLTRGNYDAESGLFKTLHGQEKYYVASDHLQSERYCVFTPNDLFDILSDHRLHFDHSSQTGIVLHMMSGVGTYGNLGLTAVADTPGEAAALYEKFQAVLEEEAGG